MATNPTGPGPASIVERAKNIIVQPKSEWPRIDAEPATIADIYKSYVVILAAIGPVAGAVGLLVFGFHVLGISYRPSVQYIVVSAIIQYLLSLVSVYVLALIIDGLAPSFGGTKDKLKAFKVAAYCFTPAWLAGAFGIVPALAWLSILGLYSLYLLYLGLPVLMKAPADKTVGYAVVSILAAIVLWAVVAMIAGSIVAAFVGLPGPGSLSVTMPG